MCTYILFGMGSKLKPLQAVPLYLDLNSLTEAVMQDTLNLTARNHLWVVEISFGNAVMFSLAVWVSYLRPLLERAE